MHVNFFRCIYLDNLYCKSTRSIQTAYHLSPSLTRKILEASPTIKPLPSLKRPQIMAATLLTWFSVLLTWPLGFLIMKKQNNCHHACQADLSLSCGPILPQPPAPITSVLHREYTHLSMSLQSCPPTDQQTPPSMIIHRCFNLFHFYNSYTSASWNCLSRI